MKWYNKSYYHSAIKSNTARIIKFIYIDSNQPHANAISLLAISIKKQLSVNRNYSQALLPYYVKENRKNTDFKNVQF